jgi:hypothetical protein
MERNRWGAEATGENQRSAPLGKEGGQARRIRDTKMAAGASESLTHGQNIFVCCKLHRAKVAAYWRSATDDLIEAAGLDLWAVRIFRRLFEEKISNAKHRESFPPPHVHPPQCCYGGRVGGYGSSSAASPWKPAWSACGSTTAARKAQSRRRRSWRVFWQSFGSEGHEA